VKKFKKTVYTAQFFGIMDTSNGKNKRKGKEL